MKRGGGLLVAIVLATALLPAIHAASVVINSEDWIDVYSGMLYARMTGQPSLFMTSQRYVTVLPLILPKGDQVLVIESERFPYAANLGSTLRRQGHDPRTIYSRGGFALNLELARELNRTRFVIVDPTYGFNAVSVAPYALATNGFVLFADAENIDQVVSFLISRPKLESLLIYGQVAGAVLEKLSGFSPEIINTGHRYKDNIEILTRYFQVSPNARQAVLTGGEFLETQVMGGEPVVLVGRERVLQNTIDFVKNSSLETTVLIGNELTGSAKRLKDATGIPVFVKVGQGIPAGIANYEPIKALDMFFLPTLLIQVDFGLIQYNALEKVIEIVFRNKGVRAFLTSTITVRVDGGVVQTLGDKDLQRLERNETRGFRYAIDLSSAVAENRNLTAEIFTIYGESPEILDRAIEAEVPIQVSTGDDQCELKLGKVTFDERTQRISVGLKNPSGVDCYASINLLDVIIDDQPQLINYPGQALIQAGSKETFKIKQRMTPVDLEDNPLVHVRVLYGERDGLLFKVIDKTVPFGRAGDYTMIIIAGIIALLLILVIILFLLWRRSRKQQSFHQWRADYSKWRGKRRES
jgi:hypothetical protein